MTGVRFFDLYATDDTGHPVTMFGQTYTLTTSYTNAEITALQIYSPTLNLVLWSGATWINMLPCNGCVHDMTNRTFIFKNDHLSEYALIGFASPRYLPEIEKR